jgi:hypothetical protein
MPAKQAFPKARSGNVFGRARKPPKVFRAGLYARVSTNDRQTLPMQTRALREYAARRDWTIAAQVREVGSGTARREARENLPVPARRREIDVVLVWRLDRWGRPVTGLLATLQELEHVGVGLVSLTEALDLTTPAGRAMAGILAILSESGRQMHQDRPGSCAGEWKTSGTASRSRLTPCGNPETASRWRWQIRDRPPVADRAHPSLRILGARHCGRLSRRAGHALVLLDIDALGAGSTERRAR